MKQPKFNKGTKQFFKRTIPPLITTAIALQILLTGCASVDRKDDSIDAILAKENVLIQKVQAERSQADVASAVQQSASLMKAEAHLSLALEEMLKANEVVTTKLINQDEREVLIERNTRNNR